MLRNLLNFQRLYSEMLNICSKFAAWMIFVDALSSLFPFAGSIIGVGKIYWEIGKLYSSADFARQPKIKLWYPDKKSKIKVQSLKKFWSGKLVRLNWKLNCRVEGSVNVHLMHNALEQQYYKIWQTFNPPTTTWPNTNIYIIIYQYIQRYIALLSTRYDKI